METKEIRGRCTYVRQMDFCTDTSIRDREGNYIMIKG